MVNLSIVRFLLTIIRLVEITIFIRIILSYIRFSDNYGIVENIYIITDYIMYPAKKLLHVLGLNKGFIDFSGLLTLIGLNVLSTLIVRIFS